MGRSAKAIQPPHSAQSNHFLIYFFNYYYSLELVLYWVNKWNDLRGGVRAGAV